MMVKEIGHNFGVKTKCRKFPRAFIILIIFISFLSFTKAEDIQSNEYVEENDRFSETGYTDEGSDETIMHTLEIPSDYTLTNIKFNLSWEDEDDMISGIRTYENQPDYFTLEITSPSGEYESETRSDGIIEIAFSISSEENSEYYGDWEIRIICEESGDFINPSSMIGYTDSGNDWELMGEWVFVKEVDEKDGVFNEDDKTSIENNVKQFLSFKNLIVICLYIFLMIVLMVSTSMFYSALRGSVK
jgi:hypothetical protein